MIESSNGWMRGASASEVVDAYYENLCTFREGDDVMWLPVQLKTKLCEQTPRSDTMLPSDVVLWLFELRHCTHLYESLDHPELTTYRDSDPLCICKENLEYSEIEPGFKNTYSRSDEISVDDNVHVETHVSLISESCNGSITSEQQLRNRNANVNALCLSSVLEGNKRFDKTIVQQTHENVYSNVYETNTTPALGFGDTSLLDRGNVRQLMWRANPVYRVLPKSETSNTLAVNRSGGDAKLRKLSEEGATALGREMNVVSVVQDVDRCSYCGVANFPVDNALVDQAPEQYDNVAPDEFFVVPRARKNKTWGKKYVSLQNADEVRGIYCIQESAADSEELSASCDDNQECAKKISVEHLGNLTNDNVSENGSINEINFNIYANLGKCENISKKVNSASDVTCSDIKTIGFCDWLWDSTEKLSAKHILDSTFNCEDLVKHFQDIVFTLEIMDGITQCEIISVSVEDSDLNSIFDEVENLADEVLGECNIQSKIVKGLPLKKSHIVSCTSSDLSDDVFFTSVGSEYADSECNGDPEPHTSGSEQRRDINSIFDNGVMPPVRPERKKLKVKLRNKHSTNENISNRNQQLNSSSKMDCEDDVSNISTSPLPSQEYISVNDSKDLLLLQKVSLSSKEKRSLHSLSFYEDADTCCGGSSEVHTCNIVSLTSGSLRDENFAICDGVCRLSTSAMPVELQFGSTDTNVLLQSKPELLNEECSLPNDLNESFCELLNVYVPQVKSISSCQFPPEDIDEVPLSKESVIKIPGDSDECDAPTDGLFSLDSLGRTRKGSGSSDIAAWKQELQKSVLSWFDDESENEWFSSLDSEGRVYYFEENSNESSWALPSTDTVSFSKTQEALQMSVIPKNENVKKKREQVLKSLENDEDLPLRHKQVFTEDIVEEMRSHGRVSKSRSMVLFDPKHKSGFLKSSTTSEWPQLWKGDMGVLKEGPLNRTKITENGKRLRKNWSPAYVVLTELFLLIFKDNKAFAAMKNITNSSGSSPAHPELCVDLNGALIDHANKESSRKNVFIISTVLGLQVLLQSDNAQLAEKWYQEIDRAIKHLPSGYDSCTRPKLLKDRTEYFRPYSPDDGKKSSHMIERSRSVKVRNKDGSSEDLSTSADERQTKIRDRLKKFFHRRPTKELLMKKGIYKDEPVFGRHLADVCSSENPPVPRFVRLCIEAIESKEENMKADGLYRASGNLSQVQKIRLQVDQNNLTVLEQEEDVHVLTGALKLFFRELKSPVIPFEFFNTALQASTNSNKKEKIHQFQVIVKKLPTENRCTLEFLLQHLLKVTKFHKSNRMHISNLAIVFGPTLMWPEEESLNMAFDLMQQNLVIECFLQEFDNIFR
ncbi:uncharacterized protein LOC134529162 isoform X2 [Bacillus rossius redtenbacheri]|uniref:uncharacterized protein LOC134529162 isoform X2 n=1 Tax=Bacillus rossius redtenbacheri TaxID=93214 RepID=UPI002FDE4296